MRYLFIGILLILFTSCIDNDNNKNKLENTVTRNDFQKMYPLFTYENNVKDFGAIGDGLIDDTSAIQNAIDSANDFDTIYFPKGKYLVSSTLIINKSNICLKGKEAIIVYKPSKNIYFDANLTQNGTIQKKSICNPLLLIQGKLDPKPYFIENTLSETSKKIILNSDYDYFSKGDLILITQNDYGKQIDLPNKAIKYFREQNFLTKIDLIQNENIYLLENTSIPFYKSIESKIYKLDPVKNVIIYGLSFKILNKDELYSSGIVFDCASESIINDVSIFGASKSSIKVSSSYKINITNSSISDMKDFSQDMGIGIHLSQSHYTFISNCFINQVSHGILLDNGNSHSNIFYNKIIDSRVEGAIALQGKFNYSNNINNNKIYESQIGIIVGGGNNTNYNDGPQNKIISNFISDCNIGIELRNETKDIIVEENKFASILRSDVVLTNLDASYILQ